MNSIYFDLNMDNCNLNLNTTQYNCLDFLKYLQSATKQLKCIHMVDEDGYKAYKQLNDYSVEHHHTCLWELDLSKSEGSFQGKYAMIKNLPSNITALQLNGCIPSGSTIPILFQGINIAPQHNSLEYIGQLPDIAHKLTNIKKLQFTNVPYNKRTIETMLKNIPQLQVLDLCFSDWQTLPDNMNQILNTLSNYCNQLEYVRIKSYTSFNTSTPDQKAIQDLIKACPQLTYLDLGFLFMHMDSNFLKGYPNLTIKGVLQLKTVDLYIQLQPSNPTSGLDPASRASTL